MPRSFAGPMRAPTPPPLREVINPETLIETLIQSVGVTPAEVDLNIYRGDDLKFTLPVLQGGVPATLTGYTVTSQIRATIGAVSILATLTCTITGSNIDFWVKAVDSATLPLTGGVWDAQLVDGTGIVTTFVLGKVVVTGDVTQ